MTPKRIIPIHFSATGTTRKVVMAVAGAIGEVGKEYDLLESDPIDGVELTSDDLAVVGMPVYAGRIPPFARRRLERIHGSGTPAVAVVVYGNRAYDDALVELGDILTESGFAVIGAGAFIGEHCIFPRVAAGRPDDSDIGKAEEFGRRCREAVGGSVMGGVPGNRPYVALKAGSGLQPTIDMDTCILCGACVKRCPTGSLLLVDGEGLVEKDVELCISCAACVKVCPKGSQAFRGAEYEGFGKVFEGKFSERREPETFV